MSVTTRPNAPTSNRDEAQPTVHRRRRLIAMAVITIPLAAATVSADATAQSAPSTISPCAKSPIETATVVLALPLTQLRAEIDASANSTERPVLDVLLQRVEFATLDQLSRLPGAGDIDGPTPADAATALIDRYNATRAILIAQAWGDCRP
jgi:hypothetical protein